MYGKRAVLGAVAAAILIGASASIYSAQAATFPNSLSLTGGNNLDLSAQTITFNFGNPFNVATETGIFAVLGSGGSVTWRNQGTPINFNALTTGSDLGCGGCMFFGSNFLSQVQVSFDLTSENPPIINGGFVDLSGTGSVALAVGPGFSVTPATFSLSTQGGTALNLTFSSTLSTTGIGVTPIPETLPLLASGLVMLGFVGWWGKRTARSQRLAAGFA